VVEFDLARCGPAWPPPAATDRVLLEDMSERFHQDLPGLSGGREHVAGTKVELGAGRRPSATATL